MMNFTTLTGLRKVGRCRYALLSLGALAAFEIFAATPDPEKTRQLVAVVQSEADVSARARALQQLAIVGSADAVPALAGLLADEKLAHYARDVLQVMPDPRAGRALREALTRLHGNLLIGVIHSVGLRQDAEATDALVRLSAHGDPAVAGAALRALGRIATPGATRALEQALARGPAELRAAAAEGGLLGADRLFDAGRRPEAVVWYDAVRRADLPEPLRVTASRGAILARSSGGMALLIEALQSDSEAMRDMALLTFRDVREPGAAATLAAVMPKLTPALQALAISALAERQDPIVLTTAEAGAASADADVRLASLKALGLIGHVRSLDTLVAVAAGPETDPAVKVALAGLSRFHAAETDALLLKMLPKIEPAIRVRFIGVLAERKANLALPELFKLAEDANTDVAKAALRALGLIAGPADLPQLLRLASAARDDEMRTLADRAIVTTSMKVLAPGQRADAVIAAFRAAAEPGMKAALARPLWATARAMGGSFEAFSALRAALVDPAEEVRAAALRFLADWPDAAPVTTLLEFANKPATAAAQREIALRGALRLVGNVAAGRERSPLDVVTAIHQAARAVRTTDEKRLLIATIGEVRRPEAAALLHPFLDDPAVRADAAAATKRVAAPAGAPKGKAKKAAAVAPPARNGPLFTGADLGNWDGDPGVWRVRDGAIVGGSLEGNPRNEFLATTRRYRNFVLKLDYKLVGTQGFVNGGVQFRSVRIAQPPNEMSGYQADIGAGHSGSLYDESRRKKFLARATDEQVKRLEKPGEWNRYEIRCEGPRVELTLNGERTVAYVEEDASVGADGLIALQIHGNCKAEIAFRNITVEELP